MTLQELRVFLGEWFCVCGGREEAAERLRDTLALHPLYSNREAFKVLVPDEGLQYFLLYTLDHFDLTEHGGTVGGGWLTSKGQAVLNALNQHSSDGFGLICATSCLHGYSFDDDYPEPGHTCT